MSTHNMYFHGKTRKVAWISFLFGDILVPISTIAQYGRSNQINISFLFLLENNICCKIFRRCSFAHVCGALPSC